MSSCRGSRNNYYLCSAFASVNYLFQLIDLSTPITYLPGVGPQRAKLLESELNISTFRDLLYYFPYKHIDRTRLYYVHELTPEMPFVQVKGEILSFEEEGHGRKRRLIAHFTDGMGLVDLVWFQPGTFRWIKKNYLIGKQYIVFGRPGVFKDRINIPHPDIDPADSLQLGAMGLQPYYNTTERMKKGGLNSRSIERFTGTLFEHLSSSPLNDPDPLPTALRQQLNLIPLWQSLHDLHYPPSAEALRKATHRQKFEELFFIQLGLLRFARLRQQQVSGYVFAHVGEHFNTFYRDYLPFELTNAQKRVIREMRHDMGSGKQMNRLLQGDVGSGKTLVALMTMLIALDNGYQACLMAPTEILAEQHYATFKEFLGDMPVRVELLTGAVKGKRRREPILKGTRAGEVNILIGTHAVLEDTVAFNRLGLVVIDEQHRFGVAQRAKLWKRPADGAGAVPHVLVMTATPIPRTLAMTLYGDLDVSVIDELPPGRKPIETRHFWEERTESLYRGIRAEISKGRQVYVVYPLIKESEKMDIQDLENGYADLCQAFPDLRISRVHGQMKSSEKDDEMDRFVRGETQILVATTVIEVGVNVPNASVMVIQNAERFGLAQLHQLRGRVGRGAEQSYCILVTKYQISAETKKRIEIMCETNDGFEIAEADLKFRGPGDLEGTQQSGMAFDLHIANLARDGQLVQLARDTANHILDEDPQQCKPEYASMWQHLRDLGKSAIDWSNIS
ncbi:MAG: ATP-dependent DNA helicase RecG [Prevotella sp.]|nr:ATP-dependent DNA helicase RecG [Prevotella sp.]